MRTALSSSATQTGSTWLCTRLGKIEPSPAFLHAGIKVTEPADVRAQMERVEADGVNIMERNDEAAYVAFKCRGPDGHRIEVYWVPLRLQ
jgi:catechol 2,3-dioxygenase-like lactoylglutathione lyase family enzyme